MFRAGGDLSYDHTSSSSYGEGSSEMLKATERFTQESEHIGPGYSSVGSSLAVSQAQPNT